MLRSAAEVLTHLINGCPAAVGLRTEPGNPARRVPFAVSRCSPLAVWPLWACCYRSGSADAARSRATDPATTRAEPTAVLGLRRCTARATRRA